MKEVYFDKDAVEGTVSNLEPFTTNYAYIVVQSGAGEGKRSPVLPFQMPEGRPSQVTSLSAYAIAQNKIVMRWGKPYKLSGVLRGYNITFRECKRNKRILEFRKN